MQGKAERGKRRPAQDLSKPIGRFMLIAAWVAAFLLAVFLFNQVLERQRNPNPNPTLTEAADGGHQVVLRRNASGHYVATGRINGVPVRFLLDTGATRVALPIGLARRLGLRLAPGLPSVTANGTVETWSTLLDRVDLGGLVATEVRASVLPNMASDEVLLGMSYLKRLEMIQRGDTLTLRAPSGH